MESASVSSLANPITINILSPVVVVCVQEWTSALFSGEDWLLFTSTIATLILHYERIATHASRDDINPWIARKADTLSMAYYHPFAVLLGCVGRTLFAYLDISAIVYQASRQSVPPREMQAPQLLAPTCSAAQAFAKSLGSGPTIVKNKTHLIHPSRIPLVYPACYV